MLLRLRAGVLGLLLLLAGAPGAARADDLADFNAAVEAAAAHNRVAIGYLRTGNTDLASIELDRLRTAWDAVTHRFAGHRPKAFAQKAYVTAMTDIATRLVTADMMLNSGRPQVARDALLAIRDDLYGLRRSAGVAVLADCVRDAGQAMDRLMTFNDRHLDFAAPGLAGEIASDAQRYGETLARCDRMAAPALRHEPEFRRLVDGAQASLGKIPGAVAGRDADLLHRLLIELRSFDTLLAFRFG